MSLVTVLAAVAALEAALRLLGLGSDATTREHPWAGWVHIPGRRAVFESEDPALGRQIRLAFNSLGLRDVERTIEKPPGTTRVLVLGDSYVEAMQVPLDSALTRRLERRLDGTGGRRVEVWNGGVAGYTTTNQLLYFRHEARRFAPDLVVLCFLSGNDVADQVPALATSLRNRPFFVREGDSLRLDRSRFRDDPAPVRWARENLRSFSWLKRRAALAAERARRREPPAAAAPSPTLPTDLQIYSDRPDSVWADAWDLTERLLVALRDEVRGAGAEFLLVSISNGVQESPTARRDRPRWVGWIDRPEIRMDGPEARLERIAARHGIEYLPLLPAFRAETEATGEPLHIGWTGHWNARGHALAARVLGDRLAARLEHPPPPAAAPAGDGPGASGPVPAGR